MASKLRKLLGNAVDIGSHVIGNGFLPDFGISERLAGGRTATTGTAPISFAPNVAPGVFNGPIQRFANNAFAPQPGAMQGPPQPASPMQGPPVPQPDYSNLFNIPTAGGGSGASGSISPDLTASGGVSSTDGTTPTTQPQLVEYPPGSGYYYDVNSPEERTAFYTARAQDLVQERDKQLADLHQQIADLTSKARQYVESTNSQIADLTGNKSVGDLSRINTFSQASPNAFQSSEGTSYNAANENYLKGIGSAVDQANTAVGANYFANPNDPTSLGADTTFGRGIANLNSGINDVGTQYNQQLAGLNQQTDPNTDPFRFDNAGSGITEPGPVDLSAFKPFTGFTNVPASASPGASFVPSGNNAFSGNTSLDAFLGRSPGLSQQDKDYLSKYLLGNVS